MVHINPETGMSYWGGEDEYREYYALYELDGYLFIERESRVHPYNGKWDYFIKAFDTYEEALAEKVKLNSLNSLKSR